MCMHVSCPPFRSHKSSISSLQGLWPVDEDEHRQVCTWKHPFVLPRNNERIVRVQCAESVDSSADLPIALWGHVSIHAAV
jgi:hypothetical protein